MLAQKVSSDGAEELGDLAFAVAEEVARVEGLRNFSIGGLGGFGACVMYGW